VGTVVEAGPDAADVAPGRRVWSNSLGHAGRQGPTAEFAVVPSDRLYALPDGVDPVQAVAVLHPAATAYLAIAVHGRVRPAETVFVAGGAGSVGAALIVLAKRAGAHVIASARGDGLDYCRSLGADDVVDFSAAPAVDSVRALRPAGVDVIVDTSGRGAVADHIEALAHGGRLVAMAGLGLEARIALGRLYAFDRSIVGFAISNASVADLAAAADYVNGLLADGAFVARAVEELPLERARDAHERIEAGLRGGLRLVIRP
jgi:NADPH:quinone reductase-like Zn-dependent oxidoreductase